MILTLVSLALNAYTPRLMTHYAFPHCLIALPLVPYALPHYSFSFSLITFDHHALSKCLSTLLFPSRIIFISMLVLSWCSLRLINHRLSWSYHCPSGNSDLLTTWSTWQLLSDNNLPVISDVYDCLTFMYLLSLTHRLL